MKFAFDIDGVITKYPEIFRTIIDSLLSNNHEVIIITGRSDERLEETVQQLAELKIEYTKLYILPDRFIIKDARTLEHWQRKIKFKVDVLEKEKVDMIFDDMNLYIEILNKLRIPSCRVL